VKVLLIAGPTHVPLDEARSIINRSTGKTGLVIAELFHKAGHSVSLWLGEGTTHPVPPNLNQSAKFHTLNDLEDLIVKTNLSTFDVILLPAALPDYDLHQALGPDNNPLPPKKWPGSLEKIQVELRPCSRVLPTLRSKAPNAKIIGWKWEAGATLKEAIRAAQQQCLSCKTSASVLNGPAYGTGYLLIPAEGENVPCADAQALGEALLRFLNG
jgi:phosphopantothenoylcysteine decarboxylase/phosphopantothenate--cysteine ligase